MVNPIVNHPQITINGMNRPQMVSLWHWVAHMKAALFGVAAMGKVMNFCEAKDDPKRAMQKSIRRP